MKRISQNVFLFVVLTKLVKLGIIFTPPTRWGGVGAVDMKHDDALHRLKNVEGHLRGIQRMIEEDKYCIDVIRQIHAAQAALNKASSIILEEHLNSCLISAVRGDDPNDRERVLQEITDIFDAATKV